MTAPHWSLDDKAPTPSLREFLAEYEGNSNLWWRIGCGHHQNLFDDAIDEIVRLTSVNTLQALVISDVVALVVSGTADEPVSRVELASAVKGYP